MKNGISGLTHDLKVCIILDFQEHFYQFLVKQKYRSIWFRFVLPLIIALIIFIIFSTDLISKF